MTMNVFTPTTDSLLLQPSAEPTTDRGFKRKGFVVFKGGFDDDNAEGGEAAGSRKISGSVLSADKMRQLKARTSGGDVVGGGGPAKAKGWSSAAINLDRFD